MSDYETQGGTSSFGGSGEMRQSKRETLLTSEWISSWLQCSEDSREGSGSNTIEGCIWAAPQANILSTCAGLFMEGINSIDTGKASGSEDIDEESTWVLNIVGEISLEMPRSNQVRLG